MQTLLIPCEDCEAYTIRRDPNAPATDVPYRCDRCGARYNTAYVCVRDRAIAHPFQQAAAGHA